MRQTSDRQRVTRSDHDGAFIIAVSTALICSLPFALGLLGNGRLRMHRAALMIRLQIMTGTFGRP